MPEAQKLLLTMPNAAAVAGKETFTQAEFQEAALKDITENLSGAGTQLARIGANNDTFLSIQEQMKLKAYLESGTYDERLAAAKKAQTITDQATKNMTDLQDANRKSRDNLQDLLNAGIVPVTTGMKGLSNAVDATVEGMTKLAEKLGVTVKKREAAPPAAAPRAAATLNERIIQAESGGRNIANQSGPGGQATSSAFGIAQITKGTFEGLVKSAQPGNPLYGKTFDDMKADVGLQREALSQLTDRNRSSLAAADVSTSDAAMYLAHFLGAAGAIRVLKLPDNAPLSAGVSEAQISANPMLKKMATIGDLKLWADQKMGGTAVAQAPVAPVAQAKGGIIPAVPGGVEVLAAEAGMNEAFVPLPDGKTIPVQIAGSDEQMSLLSAQLDRLDQLVRIMQNQVGVSEKLLKYAQ